MTVLFVGSRDYSSDDVRGRERPQDESPEESQLSTDVSIDGLCSTEKEEEVEDRTAYSFCWGHRSEGMATGEGILALPILRPL